MTIAEVAIAAYASFLGRPLDVDTMKSRVSIVKYDPDVPGYVEVSITSVLTPAVFALMHEMTITAPIVTIVIDGISATIAGRPTWGQAIISAYRDVPDAPQLDAGEPNEVLLGSLEVIEYDDTPSHPILHLRTKKTLEARLVSFFEANPYTVNTARQIAIRLREQMPEIERELQRLEAKHFIQKLSYPGSDVYRFIPRNQ